MQIKTKLLLTDYIYNNVILSSTYTKQSWNQYILYIELRSLPFNVGLSLPQMYTNTPSNDMPLILQHFPYSLN